MGELLVLMQVSVQVCLRSIYPDTRRGEIVFNLCKLWIEEMVEPADFIIYFIMMYYYFIRFNERIDISLLLFTVVVVVSCRYPSKCQ